MTGSCVLDYNTVAGVDKFGNVFLLRLPESINDSNYESPTGSRALWDQGLLNGAPNKLETIAHYYLGEMGTSVALRQLTIGGRPAIIVSTVMGGLYAFVPFMTREDSEFFTHLEMFMRQEKSSLCQRDHMSYRSFCCPVKHVIDGDLCELFSTLPLKKQMEMAADVNRNISEITKKLEDARNYVM